MDVDREAAVQQAVDDYLLMERKARAWDALLRTRSDPVLIAEMNAIVHPTPPAATRSARS